MISISTTSNPLEEQYPTFTFKNTLNTLQQYTQSNLISTQEPTLNVPL